MLHPGEQQREEIFFYCFQKLAFMLSSGAAQNLRFPAEEDNTRWVYFNYFLYAHARACSFIYALHRREL